MRVASFAFVQHLFGFQYIIPGALVLGVYLLDLFPFRYGFIQITLHGKSDTEVVTGFKICRVQFSHFSEMTDGFIHPLLLLKDDADVKVRIGIGRVYLNGPLIAFNGCVKGALLTINNTKVVMGFIVILIDGDSPFVFCDGLIQAPQFLISVSETPVGHGAVGGAFDRFWTTG